MSGGEQQMRAIGRAMTARPRLLTLDEPSMGLAPIFVDRIFETIVAINKEGTPILLVEQTRRRRSTSPTAATCFRRGRSPSRGLRRSFRRTRCSQGVPRRRVVGADTLSRACSILQLQQIEGVVMRKHLIAVAIAALAVVTVTTAAQGSTSSPASAKATLTYCTDATYPPEEYYQGSKIVGSDIDIGTEIAKADRPDGDVQEHRLRRDHRRLAGEEVRRRHQRHERHARATQAGRVRRLHQGRSGGHGQGGEPRAHQGGRRSLGPQRLRRGRDDEKDFLDAQSKLLKKKGKAAIKVVTFPKDTDAALALKMGKVDAYFGDSPVVAYYIKQDPKSFGFGVDPVAPSGRRSRYARVIR